MISDRYVEAYAGVVAGKTELSGDDILVHDNGGRLVGHLCGAGMAHTLDND